MALKGSNREESFSPSVGQSERLPAKAHNSRYRPSQKAIIAKGRFRRADQVLQRAGPAFVKSKVITSVVQEAIVITSCGGPAFAGAKSDYIALLKHLNLQFQLNIAAQRWYNKLKYTRGENL